MQNYMHKQIRKTPPQFIVMRHQGGKVGEALRANLDQVKLNYELNRLVEDAPVDKAIDSNQCLSLLISLPVAISRIHLCLL